MSEGDKGTPIFQTTGIQNRYDSRMNDLRRQGDLSRKPCTEAGMNREISADNLDRDFPAQQGVGRAVNRARGAVTDLVDEVVALRKGRRFSHTGSQ